MTWPCVKGEFDRINVDNGVLGNIFYLYTRGCTWSMKDDSQVAYVPDIEVRIKPVRSSICALFAKRKNRVTKSSKVFKVVMLC